MLRDGGAALLNLSLLTSDLWAAAVRCTFFGGRLPRHPSRCTICRTFVKTDVVWVFFVGTF